MKKKNIHVLTEGEADRREGVGFYMKPCSHRVKSQCAECWIEAIPTRYPGSEYVLITKDGLRELVRRARLATLEK